MEPFPISRMASRISLPESLRIRSARHKQTPVLAMKHIGNQRWSIQMVRLIFAGMVPSAQVSASEHSWILPGQCTPPELMHMLHARPMIGTLTPVLLPHEKLVIDLNEAKLVLEVVAIEEKATKVGWLWIGTQKVLSGFVVIENSDFLNFGGGGANKPFDFESVGGAELKGVHVACSSDVMHQRVTFSTAGRRYALIARDDPDKKATPSDGGRPAN